MPPVSCTPLVCSTELRVFRVAGTVCGAGGEWRSVRLTQDVCSWTVQRPCLSRLLCPQHWVLGWERSSACYLVPYVDSMPRDRLCSAVSSVSSVCPPLSPFFLFSKSSSSHLSLSEFLSFPFLPPSHWQFFYSLSVFFLMFYIGV